MPNYSSLKEGIERAILAAAFAAAYERTTAAQRALERLGSLSSGRWRAAGRDLIKVEEDLGRSLEEIGQEMTKRSNALGVEEEALWTIGDSATSLGVFRDSALEEMDSNSAATTLLAGEQFFGMSLLEDDDNANRGKTLLFHWADPLNPAVWPWESSWIMEPAPTEDEAPAQTHAVQPTRAHNHDQPHVHNHAEDDDDEEEEGELELYGTGELEVPAELLEAIAEAHGFDAATARPALEELAMALTRASIMATVNALADTMDDDS